jgi:hypothetical protein
LGGFFNQPLDNLPSEIKDLTLGTKFKQTLDNLPNSICKITLCSYNYTIKQHDYFAITKLPKNLKIIDISKILAISHKLHLKKKFEKFNIEFIE